MGGGVSKILELKKNIKDYGFIENPRDVLLDKKHKYKKY
jgi:hypothetical protein